MSQEQSWWKIVVGDDGKVKSCELVDHAEKNGRTVFYVQAGDEDTAARLAANRYYAANNRRRRARYEAQGKCRCGRPKDSAEFKRCKVCRKLEAEHKDRHEARKRGEEVPLRSRVDQVQRRKADEAEQARLAVLIEVQDAWLSQPTNRQFTAWLRQQIEAIAGKRVA